jgi:porphobilinogen deaminase
MGDGKMDKRAMKNCFHPLSSEAEERVDKRSVVGVSSLRHATPAIRLTLASLRLPSLFSPSAERGEGWIKDKRAKTKKYFFHPLSSEAEERVDKRSVVGVSSLRRSSSQ